MKKKSLFLLSLCFASLGPTPWSEVSAQQVAAADPSPLSLTEAIRLARKQSVDAAVALQELRAAYWQWRTYRAELLPGVNLTATLPDYRRAYSLYQQPDGSYSFVRSAPVRTYIRGSEYMAYGWQALFGEFARAYQSARHGRS